MPLFNPAIQSITLTVPAFLSVSGSPLTSNGTLAITLSGTALPVLNGGSGVTTSTGTTNLVLSNGPTLTNPIVGTQSQGDASTKAASTSYVDTAVANAVAGVNPAVAVQAATTAASDTSGFTYTHVAGIGDFFTGSVNTAVTIDGYTFTALGQRLLIKNDTQAPSGAFNGVYYVTQVQTAILAPIFTRVLDYDTPSDINNTGTIPVINGTVNGTTSWVNTTQVNAVGTDPLSFTKFTRNPADYLLKSNNLSDVSSLSTSFNNISPITSTGDIIIGNGTNSNTRLAKGTQYQTLQATSTTVAYDAVHLDQAAAVTGALPIANGGTGAATANAATYFGGPYSGSAAAPSFKAFQAPTVQSFSSGSGTYTTPAGVLYIIAEICGPGGGGAGGGTGTSGGNGAAGSVDTTFGNLTAAKGSGAQSGSNNGAAGGSPTIGSGWTVISASTGGGGSASYGSIGSGATGGVNALGGNAAGPAQGVTPGNSASNTGAGGPGGSANPGNGGAGGGAGAWLKAIIAPTAGQTFAYAIGAGGAGGTAGTTGLAGGAGGSGVIRVTEYYQ